MRIFTLLVVMGAILTGAATARAITLSTDGETDYVIVLAQDAIAPEQTAARELQTHLQLVTGAQFPIRAEAKVEPEARQLVVGPCQRFREALPDVDLASLKHDGIAIRTVGDTLFLAGGRPRGTLCAVYTFLEDTVGCRWWSSREGETFIPDRANLQVPDLDTVYVPKLQYREAFYRDAFDGVHAARLRCNGHHHRIPPEYGGHYKLLGWCHTFYRLLPPDRYFEQHPEWYSEINGERTADRAQLCLTNEEMRAELTRNALEWIRKDPSAGMISIAQNDCAGSCQCESCRALDEQEGSPSGALIRFVNAVAQEIEREFPDFLVETLAYHYTRQPPGLARPRNNVIVRLCSIECSFSQPLATGPQNESFQRDIAGWTAIAPQLYIWDYVTNFRNYILPHPNLRVLAPNIRYFVDNNAIGLFEQGDSHCSCGDFVELRTWLLAHLMWDPSLDERALIAEFLRGYYGPAAEPLQHYLDLTHDAVERAGTYLRCYMHDTSSWLGLEDLNRATELFADAARRVEDDPVLTARVRRARMPLDHAWIQRHRALRLVAKILNTPFLGPADPLAFCEDFIQAAHDFDVGSHAEGQPFANLEPALRAQCQPPGAAASLPTEAEGLGPEDWFDVQEAEFTLHRLGQWVTVVEDPKASNGKAARMPASHTQWAVQFPLSGDLSDLGRWHCYVVVRCEPKTQAGNAYQIGLYGSADKKGVVSMTETLERAAAGEYRTHDLGAHELKSGMYFWVAPMGKPDEVDAVFVDRIFCIREQ